MQSPLHFSNFLKVMHCNKSFPHYNRVYKICLIKTKLTWNKTYPYYMCCTLFSILFHFILKKNNKKRCSLSITWISWTMNRWRLVGKTLTYPMGLDLQGILPCLAFFSKIHKNVFFYLLIYIIFKENPYDSSELGFILGFTDNKWQNSAP